MEVKVRFGTVVLLSLCFFSCNEESKAIIEESSAVFAVVYVDTEDGKIKGPPKNFQIMDDETFEISYFKLLPTPEICEAPGYACICAEPSVCSRFDIVGREVGMISAEEINAKESLIRTPSQTLNRGRFCRYYSVDLYRLNDLWEARFCSDSDLDSLDVNVQRVINDLEGRM
jgi:hypothetical protein